MIIDLLHRFIQFRYHQLGFQSKTLELKSCRIHFYQRHNPDNSRHILFVHGLGTSSSTWIKILPSILNYGTIMCLDLPGCGFSRIRNGELFFSLEQQERTLDDFFSRKQQPPVILVGHSLGGWLAARYTFQHPHSVNHLILISNAGIKYPGFEEQAEAFKVRTVDDTRRLLDRMWFQYPWYFKPFTSSIYHSLHSKYVGEFVASIREKDFINDRLSSFTKPVDVIWGNEDKLISIESLKIMEALIPHLHSHIIPRCGHVPQLERPKELVTLLKQILEHCD